MLRGTNIMKAATEAGVELNSICGGKGKCGKCRVIVTGRNQSEATNLISPAEKELGMVLACQSRVLGDIRVFIPDSSTTGRGQILTEMFPGPPLELDPVLKKVYIEMSPPTLEDSTGDLDRLYLALKERGYTDPMAWLGLMKRLPTMLRRAGWKVTASIFDCEGTSRLVSLEPGDTTRRSFGLAVDIGTTTVVAYLINLCNGDVVRSASSYNKQLSCGEDVISRIDYAVDENGLETLQRLVVETINRLVEALCVDVRPEEIGAAIFAGNTTMTHLFLGIHPGYIKLEPYIPAMNFLAPVKAMELGLAIEPRAVAGCLPCRSSYVGGDITGDILACGMQKMDGLYLLIDVGTNGEVVLGNKDWLVGCSCSAGPAFEGGEVRHGMRAADGAIERVEIMPDFEPAVSTIGKVKPAGICGSGLIDLLSGLLMTGAVDRTGKFTTAARERSKRFRDGDEGQEYVIAWKGESSARTDIFVTEADIKNLIRTKAAVYAACSTLVRSVSKRWDEIDRIFIAGGFGRYLSIPKAVSIGLFPDLPRKRFQYIGNGAASGARRVLLSRAEAEEAGNIVRKLTYMELTVNNDFMGEFTSALFLPHTDMNLFPSVNIRRG
jgi:uncharacterized 2Fe-2S/4Fe-4S cluster protein (DUF4445 family)